LQRRQVEDDVQRDALPDRHYDQTWDDEFFVEQPVLTGDAEHSCYLVQHAEVLGVDPLEYGGGGYGRGNQRQEVDAPEELCSAHAEVEQDRQAEWDED
jgi:hypothetical protein